MAVSRYFGLPGSGKTTVLTQLALDGVRSKKYNHVYGNVHLNLPGYTYVPFDYFGKFEMVDCLLLIDEATIECGDRDYKSFPKEKLARFMLHRHDNMDIALFSQSADGMDKKIRDITDRMYYIKKGFLLGSWISTIYKVPYKVIWPSGENNGGENVGRILMGYVKPSFLEFILAKRIYRPALYQYFDSWERTPLPPLPPSTTTVPRPIFFNGWQLHFYIKNRRFLKAWKKKKKETKLRQIPLIDDLYVARESRCR